MSYSFSATGATKAEVLETVKKELDQVVAGQPVHAADRDQALAAATAFIGLLPDEAPKGYNISVNGSIWSTDKGVQSASVGVNVNLNQ